MRGHFTPEDVVRAAAERGQRIVAATVYRNLPVLLEAGIVVRAPSVDGSVGRYELGWAREHHDHLFCSRCGLQIEFKEPAIEVLQEHVAKELGFVLEQKSQVLVGRCAACRADGAGGTA